MFFRKTIKFLLISSFILSFAPFGASRALAPPDNEIVITSPAPSDIRVTVSVSEKGDLQYKIDRAAGSVIRNSRLGITVSKTDLGNGVRLGEPKRDKIDLTFPVMGVHSTGRHHCNTARIPVTHIKSKKAYFVDFRACEGGVGYRYDVPEKGRHTVNGEASSWRFPENVTFWYQPNTREYEGLHEKTVKVAPKTQIGPPMIVVYPGGGYAAVSEAAASARYSGMTLGARENNIFEAEFLDDTFGLPTGLPHGWPLGWTVDGGIVTPWRVTVVAKDLNELVNADLIPGLNPPPSKELENAPWIRPGRSVWSYLTGDRVVTPENMRKYVDAAAELGFEYVLVDEGWEQMPDKKGGWFAPGKNPMDMMGELVDYAKKRNVRIWVWTHHTRLLDPKVRAEYFDSLARIGVVGDKIDFMNSESAAMLNFYESCLREAAQRHLMIDFHGANKPTGESRTWPNEMAREGIRGLEYRELPVYYTTALPFTRFIAGHADFTPMHFNILWMSNTTRGYQLASGLILDSAVTFFGGEPKDYLKSPARDLIEAMPTVWDETIVLGASEMGKIAAFARRSKDTWFIAVMNGDEARKIEIKLDFLKDGKYRMEAYRDPSIKKSESEVVKNDVLPVGLRASGGFVARIYNMQ